MKEEECDARREPGMLARHKSIQKFNVNVVSKKRNYLPDILFKPVREDEIASKLDDKPQPGHKYSTSIGKFGNETISFKRLNYHVLVKPTIQQEKALRTQRETYDSRNHHLSIMKQSTYDNSKTLASVSKQVIERTPQPQLNINAIEKLPALSFDITSFNSPFKPNVSRNMDIKKRNSAKLTTLKMLWKQKEFVEQQIHILQVQKTKLSDQIQKASAKLLVEK
jgi:hypothetical protein